MAAVASLEMAAFGLQNLYGPHVLQHPSPVVQAMIQPFKNLAATPAHDFDGKIRDNSDEMVAFLNRLKPDVAFPSPHA